MKVLFDPAFKGDNLAMEEIGFIYVFALSVLLLTAIFFTIRDSTDIKKESATKTYLEDQVRLIAGVVQDVIDLHFTHPEINYTRVFDLTPSDQVYQFRMEFTRTSLTLISRYQEITASAPLYNPSNVNITSNVESDVSAIRIHYDSEENFIEIRPTDPNLVLV